MYVVAGVTGNTGAVVARTLLQAGHKVRVIVRSAEKGQPWQAQGAEVAIADVGDAAALSTALSGAHSAYLMLPPDYSTTDFMGRAHRIIEAMVTAVKQSGIGHITLLSSVGAQHEHGTGVVRSLYQAERALCEAGVGLAAIRAGYFMENWGMVLPAVFGQGVLPSFLTAHVAIPMVATADIGTLAAQAMLGYKSRHRIIELAGPKDYSPNEVAEVLAQLTGKAVQVIEVPEPGMVPGLLQAGLTQNMAELMAELNVAINRGHASQEPGTERVHGTTPLEHVLGGMLQGGKAH